MSDVARQLFTGEAVLIAPVIAMLIFSVVFMVAVIRIVLTKKDKLEHLAQLPLETEQNETAGDIAAGGEVSHG